MADLETIWEDKKAWFHYNGEEGQDETISVYRRCPECGKYLKKGEVLINRAGEVRMANWICFKHGEIEPYWDRY